MPSSFEAEQVKTYPLRKQPSEHQLQVLAWIRKFQSLYGKGPLLREVGEAFDVGRQAASNICQRLEHYGLLERAGSKLDRMKATNKEVGKC